MAYIRESLKLALKHLHNFKEEEISVYLTAQMTGYYNFINTMPSFKPVLLSNILNDRILIHQSVLKMTDLNSHRDYIYY